MSDNTTSTNAPTIFNHTMFGNLRAIHHEVTGEPWFVAKDVCGILEIGNNRDAVSSLDDDEKDYVGIPDAIGRNRMTTVISEPGLYSLILRSHKPEAKAFKRWVTHEVLPSIRKTGGYIKTNPEDTPEVIMARAILVAADTINHLKAEKAALESKVEHDAPKVTFAESVEVSPTTILVGQLAKLIKQSTGYDIGRDRLFDWLRRNNYLCSHGREWNYPTQQSMNAELMEVQTSIRILMSGEKVINHTPKVTGKGQVHFINRFKRIAAKAA